MKMQNNVVLDEVWFEGCLEMKKNVLFPIDRFVRCLFLMPMFSEGRLSHRRMATSAKMENIRVQTLQA